jgi:hypothetical protein
MKLSRKIIGLFVAIALISGTADARHFEHKEHHIGPTGIKGVTSATNIKVVKVEAGSPADGKLKAGDVIIGVGSVMFKKNARREMADLIDQAETRMARGIMPLTLKDGRKVNLQLKVLGSYSDTAPYNCTKTDAIITQTADYLVKSKKFGRGNMNIGLLGLLATGEQKYIDAVKNVIHGASWAKPDIDVVSQIQTSGRHAWGWGYTNLLLCEYYLLTGDKYVLPAIKQYSVAMSTGRDAGGLWGHGMAYLEPNRGQKHGRLFGYAQINQSSLALFISMILADKCGIRHPELQAGIEQTHTFYNDFVGKGALPYGVHDPFSKAYNNNGTSGSAAVAFAVKGNKEGASFYSRCSATSHSILETGHTGHFFNQLWTGLGANVAGPEISAEFFKKSRWLHTLNRTWDGSFVYDCCEYKQGIYSYRGLSDAGSHLLNYCLGRGKLYITGRDADQSVWLKGKEVSDTMALSSINVKNKSADQLLALFGHSMPQVRVQVVWTLRAKEGDSVMRIIKMLRSGTKEEKLSAVGYFGYKYPTEKAVIALKDIARLLRDPSEDLQVRGAAASALCWHGEAAKKYYGDMLKVILEDKPQDPLGITDWNVAKSMNILCPDPYKAGMVAKNKALFYKAALKMMDHRRHHGRAEGAKMVINVPIEDFYIVADKVMHLVKDEDLTYHSYHGMGPKIAAISVLANLNVREGIEYALATLDSKVGKFGFKVRMLMNVLPRYGSTAKEYYPKFKYLIKDGRFKKGWDNMIKKIESDTKPRKMISFEEAKQLSLNKRK